MLLSLDINAAAVARRLVDGNEWIESESFGNERTSLEYDTRLRLLEANRNNGAHFTVAATAGEQSRVRLSEFARWLLNLGFDMPMELAALATQLQPQLPPTVLAASESGNASIGVKRGSTKPAPHAEPVTNVRAPDGVEPAQDAPAVEATAPRDTQAAPVVAASAGVEPAIDFNMLAQRHELIAAFGTFTGLDESWFDNLRDRPRLFAACKVKGTGGRNYTEPLFCPYTVMQWLITKPKVGSKRRRMSAETGWRMLKANFLKVYSTYKIGDPNGE